MKCMQEPFDGGANEHWYAEPTVVRGADAGSEMVDAQRDRSVGGNVAAAAKSRAEVGLGVING